MPRPRPGRPRRETPAEAAERIVLNAGGLLNEADAQTRKENSLARLRQLEYDTKAGQVVLIRDVAEAIGAEYARVRTRLLGCQSASQRGSDAILVAQSTRHR